jgi:hypothetical protein
VNTDLLADELATYALQKHAADDDEFSDDIEKQKSVDRKQKLKLALIGLGALGAGGAAAWALSGDAGKAVGRWIGGKESTPLADAALNPIAHGLGAGLLAGVLRSPIAGRIATGVSSTGETTRGGLYRSNPGFGANALSDAGLLPQSTPSRFAYDVTQLGSEYKAPTLLEQAFKPVLPNEGAMADFKGALKSYDAVPAEAKKVDGTPKVKDELKAAKLPAGTTADDQPFLDGLKAKRSPDHLVSAVKEFELNGPSPMKASMSGLYVQEGGRFLPLSATNMSPDQLMRATIMQGSIDPATGKFSLDPYGSKPANFEAEIGRAANTTVDYQSMTPQRQAELFLMKQSTAPKLMEYISHLNQSDPAQAALRSAIISDLLNTHNVGTYAETKYTPRTETTPSPERILNLLSDRVAQRANFMKATQAAMQKARYGGLPAKPVGVGVRTGAATAAASFLAQQLIGLTTDHYLGEDQ